MKTLVFTAQAFGFGPVSKCLTISEKIQNVKKVFFGTGVALDLARLHSFDEIHELHPENRAEIISILQRCDLFINVMDFPLNELAIFAKCPYIIIDTLLWFWKDLPEGAREAQMYFCQDFFGLVQEKIKKYHLKNARVVGSIVDHNFQRKPKINQVIINFAGLENPFVEIGKNSDYPFLILVTILPILKNRFASILVVGLQKVMEMCREKFGNTDKIAYKMLNKKEMLEELFRSEALITAPGGETIFDAYDKVPIFCLPPQNNSNFDNLNIYVRHGVIKYCFPWPELSEADYNRCNTEKEQVELILSHVNLFAKNSEHQKTLQTKLQNFLDEKDSWANIIETQKRVIEKFGGNGTEIIVEEIHKALSERMSYNMPLKSTFS